MSRLRRVAMAALLCAAMCLFSIAFIDRPVEAYVATHRHFRPVFQVLAAPSLLPLPFAVSFLSWYAIARPSWPRLNFYLALSLATLGATTAKDELKWLFGRPWPGSWVKYGLYKFQPLTDSYLYGGFPSGHTAYIAAPLCLLCWLIPHYRPLWISVMAAVMIGLVGAGYHFVADIIAGFFTGLAAAGAVASFLPSAIAIPSWPRHLLSVPRKRESTRSLKGSE
jgi:membrane-associated phospholipid phosphatase